jgi:hypothetical protein
MDSSHALGCSLIGMAITALMIRIFWMSSPPFNNMEQGPKKRWQVGLVATTLLTFIWGAVELGKPIDEQAAAARAAAKEGFEFH